MLFMEDGIWDSLISKPPSMTNNTNFSKKPQPQVFPHVFSIFTYRLV